jgi:tryptophanyl-tRNA synthetase
MNKQIIMSGMRPTGELHIGHYWGVINSWLGLQRKYKCFFAVADWHALTTHYQDPSDIHSHSRNMIIDWLACGIDPDAATVFVQSAILEHAELHLLLSMLTPVSWLQRIPSYKDQQQKLSSKNLDTYGFLGYPLLQTADILIYGAQKVPVGADQAAHVEIAREIARRFNWLYGTDKQQRQQKQDLLSKIAIETVQTYHQLVSQYLDSDDKAILKQIDGLLAASGQLSRKERSCLVQSAIEPYQPILSEPVALLSDTPKITGLDGQKMSKSYNNTISLRETDENIQSKLLKMPTDPARVKRTDPGNPEKCPVWDIHKVYSDVNTQQWVIQGCTTAGIGCIDCKNNLSTSIIAHHSPIKEKIKQLSQDRSYIDELITRGNERAQAAVTATMDKVRKAVGLANI